MADGLLTTVDETVAEAVARSRHRLAEAGSPTARLDAEVLVAEVLGRDRSWLAAHPEAMLDASTRARLEAWVSRRADGEPIAYLRGWKEWHGQRVRTDARALIPRPETEMLVDLAVADIVRRLGVGATPIVAWDVGTGSGAIAMVVALRFREALMLGQVRLIASDTSSEALELASENLAAEGLGTLVTMVAADLLDPVGRGLPRPDVIVANLPYVPHDELRATGSLRHEPLAALDGGPDGLDVIRRLLDELPAAAAPGAVAFLEIGTGQAEAAATRATEHGMVSSGHRDLAGIERVVEIRLP
ncbi:MAG TPA: peptide chain release factor N(5)-glutamine methyltransferase [Candidatus Saccharimonadia bacterium]|nr:peptide chain release factor N(5)-glutamine methyltransferase [Candidatus Saccharimonadia bacterium]